MSTDDTDHQLPPTLSLSQRPESLTDLVYDAILGAITSKVLAPGSRVTENGLAKELSVSKTPVREALLRLKESGLIEDHGRRGGRIAVVSVEAITDAFEAREALEVYLARRAAESASEAVAARISETAVASGRAARDNITELYTASDVEFHTAISHAVGNPVIESMLSNLLARIAAFRELQSQRSFSLTCADEHMAIAKAISEGDADRAGEVMRDHIRHACGYAIKRHLAAEQEAAEQVASTDRSLRPIVVSPSAG